MRVDVLSKGLAGLTAVAMLSLVLVGSAEAQRRTPPPLPENVAVKSVTFWSDGAPLAGDLYYPKDLKAGDKLPAIVLGNGWGGTKRGLRRAASKFAADGYIALGFDYKGWGQSGGQLVVKGEFPKPDENGEATVKVQVIRNVVDPLGWASDFRHALDFIEGEPGVDPNKIGIWGTSFGGGMVVWTAAHDSRVKAVVAQVPGMGVMPQEWMDMGRERARQLARGEIDPIPQGIDEVPGLRGTPHVANMLYYDAVKVADKVTAATLIIDAENEDLMDRLEHGKAVADVIKAKGGVPVKYHVVEGITHYGIYREAYEVSSDMALAWFNEHLK